MTVYGNGQQSRCFTWVGDVVDGLVKLSQHPKAIGEVFNIGGTGEITIIDLAKLVRRLTGSSSEAVLIPYDEAYGHGFEDMQRRVPSIEKIQNLVGYKPSLDVEGIVSKVTEYFQKKGYETC